MLEIEAGNTRCPVCGIMVVSTTSSVVLSDAHRGADIRIRVCGRQCALLAERQPAYYGNSALAGGS